MNCHYYSTGPGTRKPADSSALLPNTTVSLCRLLRMWPTAGHILATAAE